MRDVPIRYRLTTTMQGEHPHHGHGGPVKASSLMTSQELLQTLKRQLALSSPTRTSRSKSLEAGRAAAAMSSQSSREEMAAMAKEITTGRELTNEGLERLSPALMALVAEKRARLKRSTGAFSGSGGGGGGAGGGGRSSQTLMLRQVTAAPGRCTVHHHYHHHVPLLLHHHYYQPHHHYHHAAAATSSSHNTTPAAL